MTKELNTPWEDVEDQNYFRSVLKNMRGPNKGSLVKFGRQGEGIAPNYQILFTNGEESTYRGIGHKHNLKEAEYEPEHLSDYFTYQDVQSFLSQALNKKK